MSSACAAPPIVPDAISWRTSLGVITQWSLPLIGLLSTRLQSEVSPNESRAPCWWAL